jgi:hypothetical protein
MDAFTLTRRRFLQSAALATAWAALTACTSNSPAGKQKARLMAEPLPVSRTECVPLIAVLYHCRLALGEVLYCKIHS